MSGHPAVRLRCTQKLPVHSKTSGADAQEAGDGEAAAIIHWLLGDYRAAVQSLLEAPPQSMTLTPAALGRQAGRLELLQMAAAALPGVPEQLAGAKGTIATLVQLWARALDIVGAPGATLLRLLSIYVFHVLWRVAGHIFCMSAE